MADPVTLAITAAVIGAVGTTATIIGQRKQAKLAEQAQGEQRKANAISNAQQSIQRSRQIRQVIAQQRAAQAEQLQAGFSSGFAGAVGAIGSDTASALGAGLTQEGAAQGISRATGRASDLAMQSRQPNAFTQAGGFLTGISGSAGQLGGLFGGGGTAPRPGQPGGVGTQSSFIGTAGR